MQNRSYSLYSLIFLVWIPAAFALSSVWSGHLRDNAGKPVNGAVIKLHSANAGQEYTATTAADGNFDFAVLPADRYSLSVLFADKQWNADFPLIIDKDNVAATTLELTSSGQVIRETVEASASGQAASQASGGEHLSSSEVSSLPLNARDFSKLLLLAAGTMTDTNGAANFTQQFAVNGQRGTATVFAMDGFDTTDPEMGGATFSNFNVDAIQEVQSETGVIQAEIGHGAASFTNVLTKSGVNQIHGSLFEFVRNAAFDARNYFDYKDPTGKRRIPPFVRNEFGFTNGGPVVLPGIYNGRDRTFYFGEYQGFRQVLGTTQVIPVPTADERKGIDTTAYPKTATDPGDTLFVSAIDPRIVPVLNGYPLPNEPNGPLG